MNRLSSRMARAMRTFTLALLVAGPLAAEAATFFVTKTADTADGTCDADCSLREAVIAANATPGADSIQLPAGTFVLTLVGAGEDAGATGDLDITDDTTLSGFGALTIIDGNATDRVIHIHPTATFVVIGNVVIQNGNVAGFGGGIHKQGGGTVQVSGVVTGNTATGFGGGINNNDGATFDVLNAFVTSNVSNAFGGGLNNNSGGTLNVRSSTVSFNTAAGFGGGGINNNSSGTLSVFQSDISFNTAQNGAGINNNSTGQASIVEARIDSNTATGSIGGGGILNNSSGPLTLQRSTVSSNASTGFGGGGIDSNSSGPVTIENSTISGNSTTGSNGGGGIYQNSGAAITVVSATISGNASTNGGRSIHRNSVSGSLSLLNTIVANPASGTNCAGDPVTSSGFNLASDASCNLTAGGDIQNANPLLTLLQANGGFTPTHGLMAGSPAIDAGSPAVPAVDQRFVTRPVGAGFDIGAFEGTVGVALPTLSINNVVQAEGNAGTSTLTFTVTLSAASSQIVTVNYATSDATATAGSDYAAASGVVTFLPPATTQTIAVSILGDTATELTETFVVVLSGATNAIIASATGTGMIIDDDPAAPPAVVTDIPTLSEWALLLLASLLAGLGALAMRRRR